MKVYTAVGIKKQDNGGRFLVSVNTEEYVLSGVEPYIWSSLTWSFVDGQEISQRMRYLMKKANINGTRNVGDAEFAYGLRRLCTRRLVISGGGSDRECAVEGILKRSVVVPFGPSAADRSTAFWLCISHGLGVRSAVRALRSAKLDNMERCVLELLQENGDISLMMESLDDAKKYEYLRIIAGMIAKRVLTIASVKGD